MNKQTFQREFVLTVNSLQLERDLFKQALQQIQKLGTKYPGFGKSCAEIARCVLTNEEFSEQTKKTLKLIEDK